MDKKERKYAYSVYKAVANHWNVAFDECAMDIIDALPKDEVLADFLAWEGIIGYTNTIMSIVNA
jgi:hypothetical protein